MDQGKDSQLSIKLMTPAAVTVLVAAAALGLLNPYVGWLSLIIHLPYLSFAVMMKFIIGMCTKTVRKNGIGVANARYFLSAMGRGRTFNHMTVAIVWFTALLIVSVQALCTLAVQTDLFRIIDMNRYDLLLILSGIMNVVLAVLLSKTIRSIK